MDSESHDDTGYMFRDSTANVTGYMDTDSTVSATGYMDTDSTASATGYKYRDSNASATGYMDTDSTVSAALYMSTDMCSCLCSCRTDMCDMSHMCDMFATQTCATCLLLMSHRHVCAHVAQTCAHVALYSYGSIT